MSYSFTIAASSKDDAKKKIAAALDKVVEEQPIHAKDREAHETAANALIDLVRDCESSDYHVSMNGHSWSTDDDLDGATINISVGLMNRTADPA